MESLYNPDLMSEEEIKATFVARQGLIDTLVSLIAHQPEGAGMQHAVIIAPRGMGKTTVLLMVRLAIRDRGLAAHWQAVRFPEESYGVYDLADFWLAVLNHLATETNDDTLRQQAENLKIAYPDSNDLQEAALAVIKDWRRQHQKRLVALVDNFDAILEQINNDLDNARLRDVLMNDGTLMLIGGATTFFREARAYDQPLYNFFKIYNLEKLEFAEIQALLCQRAAVDQQPDVEQILKTNPGRLRVLAYFTGGNPRLVLMLYRIVTQSDISQVRHGLEKLLDEVTPFYKAKTESLPPQQRKILDHIARISSMTHEGLTPGEIATATRLPANQVSAQLKRLSEHGYVNAASVRSRSSYYVLSEPLYAIWYQMRFGHNARQHMQWLIDFLKIWYEVAELHTENERLAERFREYIHAGRLLEARDILEHQRYLTEALGDASARASAMESLIGEYLTLQDVDILKKELLPTISLESLSVETLRALYKAGCISEQDFNSVETAASPSVETQQHAELTAAIAMGQEAVRARRFDEALQYFDNASDINPDMHDIWNIRSLILTVLGRYDEALISSDQALKLKPDNDTAWHDRGATLTVLGRHEEALASHDQALKLKPDNDATWYFRGATLTALGRHEEALASYDQALKLKPDNDAACWYFRGATLTALGRHEEALESYNQALKLKPDNDAAWNDRGTVLATLGQHEEALASYDQALKLKPDDAAAWSLRGATLGTLGRYDEALASFDQALRLKSDNVVTWYGRCLVYLTKFFTGINEDTIDLARHHWSEALNSAKRMEHDKWHDMVSEALLGAALRGHLKLARQLITESDLEEPLFAVARALDYVFTGKEDLLEKLSPEVRGIVEEVVSKLREVAGQAEQPKVQRRARKPKSGSRRRTVRQLR
jgi:tetratricopeptide (TPR) repeat protein